MGKFLERSKFARNGIQITGNTELPVCRFFRRNYAEESPAPLASEGYMPPP